MVQKVSQVFDSLELWAREQEAQGKRLRLADLLARLDEEGQCILVVILSIPFLQPVPLLGLSTFLGLLIMGIGYAMLANRKLWIPRFLSQRELKAGAIVALCVGGRKVFRMIERFLKPRGKWMHEDDYFKRVAGFFIVISAFLLALPIPVPGTNTPPALALVFLALGFIEKDGAAISVGYVFFWLTLTYFGFLGWAALTGAKLAMPHLF